MGAVGFEPTKREATGLQPVSFDHSENTPICPTGYCFGLGHPLLFNSKVVNEVLI